MIKLFPLRESYVKELKTLGAISNADFPSWLLKERGVFLNAGRYVGAPEDGFVGATGVSELHPQPWDMSAQDHDLFAVTFLLWWIQQLLDFSSRFLSSKEKSDNVWGLYKGNGMLEPTTYFARLVSGKWLFTLLSWWQIIILWHKELHHIQTSISTCKILPQC